MEDEWILPPAVDSSGYPVDPPREGFAPLGQVYGTATSNAYLAEQEAERWRRMPTRERIAMANEQAKAEQQAMRLAGQMEYQQLVSGGAKPEEALRRVAHKLYFNSPTGLATALRATRPAEEFKPTITQIDGGRLIQTGPNRVQYDRDKPPVMPPDAKARQKILEGRLQSMRSGPLSLGADPKEIAKLEEEYLQNSTNWMNRADMPAPTSTATAKQLTADVARAFLAQAKGDKAAARKLARDAGYTF